VGTIVDFVEERRTSVKSNESTDWLGPRIYRPPLEYVSWRDFDHSAEYSLYHPHSLSDVWHYVILRRPPRLSGDFENSRATILERFNSLFSPTTGPRGVSSFLEVGGVM
jgi:hypothetical protein